MSPVILVLIKFLTILCCFFAAWLFFRLLEPEEQGRLSESWRRRHRREDDAL